MAESLWADLDTWQEQVLTALLGPSSAYATLQAQMVIATLVRDYHEWDNADFWQFPAVIIAGSRRSHLEEQIQHGPGGLTSYKMVNLYSWIAVCEGDRQTAMRDAKILGKRLENAARLLEAESWGQSGSQPIPADQTGEQLTQAILGDSNIGIYPRTASAEALPYYGVAALDLSFITTT